MAVIRSVIRGVGAHLPEKVVTNADLAKIVDTTDEWIVERSGIRERRIAAPHELTSTLGIAAVSSGAGPRRHRSGRHRSRDLRNGHARSHVSLHRREDPGRPRREQRRGFRRSGRVLRFRLRA